MEHFKVVFLIQLISPIITLSLKTLVQQLQGGFAHAQNYYSIKLNNQLADAYFSCTHQFSKQKKVPKPLSSSKSQEEKVD